MAMFVRFVQIVAITSAALCLVPAGAHFFELPNKMALSPSEYMTVQKIYAGWALFGVVLIIAIAATLVTAVLTYDDRTAFLLSLLAFFGIAVTLAIFLLFTYPMNLSQPELDGYAGGF